MFRIGCHLSISGGFTAMAHDAIAIGANTFQFFTRNPRGGAAKPINEKDIHSFLSLAQAHDLTSFLAHAPYTKNLCAAKPDIRKFAREMMQDDLRRMEYLPGSLYNFHPGSHVQQGTEIGIGYIVEVLNDLLTPTQTTTVLLETMTGKGSEIGRSFEELRTILDSVKCVDKMGVCLDTCHVYDAGYDLVNTTADVLNAFNRMLRRKR